MAVVAWCGCAVGLPESVDWAHVDSVVDAVGLGAGVEEEACLELVTERFAKCDEAAKRLLIDFSASFDFETNDVAVVGPRSKSRAILSAASIVWALIAWSSTLAASRRLGLRWYERESPQRFDALRHHVRTGTNFTD